MYVNSPPLPIAVGVPGTPPPFSLSMPVSPYYPSQRCRHRARVVLLTMAVTSLPTHMRLTLSRPLCKPMLVLRARGSTDSVVAVVAVVVGWLSIVHTLPQWANRRITTRRELSLRITCLPLATTRKPRLKCQLNPPIMCLPTPCRTPCRLVDIRAAD